MVVSIIIPTYNVESYLEKCLDSVINQVYKKLEIIIVDDASTDKTKEIIKKYTNKDKRIIPFYQTINKGVSASRNIGLNASTGEYIMFVDSDDLLTKDAVRRMIDISNKYDSDFVDSYHLFEYTKPSGKIAKFTEKKIPKKLLVMGSLKENLKILDMSTYVTGKLIKKSLLKGLQFDETLRRYEDMFFEHQVKIRLKNYVFMNKIVYIYHQRPNSLVNTLGKEHLCFNQSARKVKEIYEDYDEDIKTKIEAMLVSNMFLTCLTKVIKNDDTLDNNAKLAKEFLLEISDIFPNYKENKNINSIIKKYIDKFISNEDKLKKFIKKTRNINFINLYFTYLSIVNKYDIKNPLE